MKTMLSFTLLLFTALLVIAEPTNTQLIGQWRHSEDNRSVQITFRHDGTFTGTLVQNSEILWTFAGKWSLAGDMLNYLYTKSSLAGVPAGSKDRDRLVEIAKDYYIVEAIGTDGKRRKYSRIK